MTEQHPITPPPELVQQWLGKYFGTTVTGEVSDVETALATSAARWGADMELEACCQWAAEQDRDFDLELRAARRPKPPSLAEQALNALLHMDQGQHNERAMIVRRALERLQELENNG